MWPFKKKKAKESESVPISRYEVGDEVGILQRDFSSIPGVVYRVYRQGGEVLLDVQVGGECPYVKRGLKESQIKRKA